MGHRAATDDHVPLLERDAEIAVMSDAVNAAHSGGGRFVMVEAAAGLGKTRLLAEARSMASDAGLRVLGARGMELEQAFGFGVVRQLFEPVLTAADETQRSRLLDGPAGLVAAMLGATETVGGLFSATETMEERAGDFAVVHGLYWLTLNLCRQAPVAIVVDDLHWSDAASLRFLAYLLPRLDGLRLLVVAGTRPNHPHSHQHLIDHMVTDSAVAALRLAPLSEPASTSVVRARTGGSAEDVFCAACHRLAGGNPLLLHELVTAAAAEGIAGTAAGSKRLEAIGGDAIGRRIAMQLSALPPAATALARAGAVLDENAELVDAAAVAGLDGLEALEMLAALAAVQILRGGVPLTFVHPLIRAAVYHGIGVAERARLHQRAAHVLAEADAPPQRVAAHLVRVPPDGDRGAIDLLRRAADDAVGQGAPEAALTYLRRCLAEPVKDNERPELLVQLGMLATLVDMKAAAGYLAQARSLLREDRPRAQVACMLGAVLDYTHRFDEAIAVLAETEAELPDTDVDLKRRVQAYILNILIVEPRKQGLVDERRALWRLPSGESAGERLLDCSIAFHDMKMCEPAAVQRVRRGLAGGALVQQAPGEAPIAGGWVVLLAADQDEVMPMLDAAIAQGRRQGAIRDLAPAYAFRALGWLWRGHLAEAETDARSACESIDAAGVDLGRAWTAPYLAFSLAKRGRLDEATAALEWAHVPEPVPESGAYYLILEARARVLRLQRRIEEALRAALLCGEYATAANVLNPSLLGWRSEAALCLHTLGRRDEARELSQRELELARRWGAPRALGRALRVTGLVAGGSHGLAMLHEAVDVLAPSPARLEHATALFELGAALRRSNERIKARPYLSLALDLADRVGATPLAEQARTELRAAGARPRRTTVTGTGALTPSERKVAELAGAGHTNRRIAQTLFVTPKTVEVHLSSVYRKLNVKNRSEMARIVEIESVGAL